MDSLKFIYRNYITLIFVALFAACIGVSCSKSEQYPRIISDAESIADEFPDSALALLEKVDPGELKQDSIRARYYYVLASAHDRQDRVALSDSMISFSNNYYIGKDLKRSIRSATLLASYKYHIGERETALMMLDSLSSLNHVPDTLLIEPLRNRMMLFAYEGNLSDLIKRLSAIDKDDDWQSRYKFWLYFAFLYEGKPNLALNVIESLIDNVSVKGDTYMRNIYEYEKVAALMDVGRYQESLNLVDTLMKKNTDITGTPYLHLWKSLGLLNLRKHDRAAAELAIADSLASIHLSEPINYYNSFAKVLHT
ncbi:MAG: hypothetical protein K2F70_06195, partial [Muribaculaceae bacterium]|nr:hypothetical protein [Muribaculaceae bacterium]